MAIDIQIREAVLAQAITESIQARLFTQCGPRGLPGLDLDHVDTVPGSLVFADGGGTISANLRLAIFVVAAPDLMAHENGTPDGASQPAGEIGVTLVIGMVGTALTLISATSDASGLPLPPQVQQAVQAFIDTALDAAEGQALFETAQVVAALSSIAPGAPVLARGGGMLAMRFDAAGPFVPQLAGGQGWGAFLDADKALDLVRDRLPGGLPVNVTWRPNGATPSIGMELGFDFALLGIDVAGISVEASATIALRQPPVLRLAFAWDVDLSGLAGPLEGTVRNRLRQELRAMLPGATHDGAQSFFFDIPLPALPDILQARPSWGSIASSPAGLTLGGPVRAAPAAGRGILQARPDRFGRPTWFGRCRERARAGDGSAPRDLDESTLRLRAGATFSDAGAFCGAEILPPNEWLMAQANQGVDGFGFNLTVRLAERIQADVRAILRTARGVRLVNLGRPRIIRGPDGKILDVQVNLLEDCLVFSGVWLKLATGEKVTADDFRPVPLEVEGWMAALGAEAGLNSHLVTIGGLQPGEMVSVLGRGLQAEVAANREGIAILPALVGISPRMSEVVVQRLSRRRFDGPVQVETVEFTWLAALGEADEAAVLDAHGTARIARRIGDEVLVEEFRPDDETPFRRVADGGEASLNPQPLPPEPPDAARIAEEASLQDVAAIRLIPGADGKRVALARLRDGTGLVLSQDGRNRRVTGRWSGPMVGIQVDGGFAIARSGGVVHLFSVARPETVSING